MKTPEIGTELRAYARFRNFDKALSDPTTVSLKIEEPDGTKTEYTYAGAQITKESTGVYYKDFTPDAAGRWKFRWLSTGDPAVSESGWVDVAAPHTV